MYIDTVGKLKEFIKELDDNMPLIATSDNFELNGEIIQGIHPTVAGFSVVSKEFLDAFDYERYHKDVYVYDGNGQKCLKIS